MWGWDGMGGCWGGVDRRAGGLVPAWRHGRAGFGLEWGGRQSRRRSRPLIPGHGAPSAQHTTHTCTMHHAGFVKGYALVEYATRQEAQVRWMCAAGAGVGSGTCGAGGAGLNWGVGEEIRGAPMCGAGGQRSTLAGLRLWTRPWPDDWSPGVVAPPGVVGEPSIPCVRGWRPTCRQQLTSWTARSC